MSTSASSRALDRSAFARESGLLLLTIYAVIASGALLLGIAEMSLAHTFVAILFCAAHALLVGPNGRVMLSTRSYQVLGVVALAFALAQAQFTGQHISYALGHFLIFVQLIMLFGCHRSRDIRLVQVTAVGELLIADLWSVELLYLPAFVLSGSCLLANMVAVEIHRGRKGAASETGPEAEGPGLRVFVGTLWLPALIVFGLTAAGFFALPRTSWFRPHQMGGLGQPTTGFSNEVSLREIGRLRESNRMEFQTRFVELTADGPVPYSPPEVLMRGASLAVYEAGRWSGHGRATARLIGIGQGYQVGADNVFTSRDVYELADVDVPRAQVLQRVELAAVPGETLFALYRPIELRGIAPYGRSVDRVSHQISAPPSVLYSRAYEVVSVVPQFDGALLQQAGTPAPVSPWLAFWQLPLEIRPQLERVASEIESLYSPTSSYGRVRAILRYLQDPDRFVYTLDAPPYGADDPIVSFLTKTRRGYCEHFASAFVLLCRVWGIPSRLVVGFKNGQVGADGQTYTFRDRDAHAWAEVCFNDVGWVQFDPQPLASEVPQIATTGIGGLYERVMAWFDPFIRNVSNWVESTWQATVLGYDRYQQRRLFERLGEAFAGLARDAHRLISAVLPNMPDLGVWHVVVLVVLISAVAFGLSYLALVLDVRLLPPWGKRRRDRTLRFYEEFLAILRRKGVGRRPALTARELARQATLKLLEANEGDGAVGAAVAFVTDLYCKSRFGRHRPSEGELGHVRTALDALRRARPARPPTRPRAALPTG